MMTITSYFSLLPIFHPRLLTVPSLLNDWPYQPYPYRRGDISPHQLLVCWSLQIGALRNSEIKVHTDCGGVSFWWILSVSRGNSCTWNDTLPESHLRDGWDEECPRETWSGRRHFNFSINVPTTLSICLSRMILMDRVLFTGCLRL